MKTLIVGTLLLLSSHAYAEGEAVNNSESWEGASREVSADTVTVSQSMAYEMESLDLSHPWHYGRQDSDALVGRSRFDEHHD